MIDFEKLTPLLEAAFSHKITWLEASAPYSLDELVEAFYATRPRMIAALEGLTDAQVAFASAVHPFWSVSESITHLVYSQNFYHNKLLDISTSQLPHQVEAARGFGEGAKPAIPAEQLRGLLATATEQIHAAIEGTRNSHDAEKSEVTEFFGVCTYKIWVLLLLGHEIDHLRQVIAMRRVVRSEHV
jgi:hypothetical protein